MDSHLVEFIACFNRQAYFEAHDVLEEFWLITRGEKRDFYKGLIQTAVALLEIAAGQTAPASRTGTTGGVASAKVQADV